MPLGSHMVDYMELYDHQLEARDHCARVECDFERMWQSVEPAMGDRGYRRLESTPLSEKVRDLYIQRYLDPFGYQQERRNVLARLIIDASCEEAEDGSLDGIPEGSPSSAPGSEPTVAAHFSLLTPVMAELDEALVEARLPETVEAANLYKPFYYEFDALISPDDADSLEALENLKSELAFNGNVSDWFPAKLADIEDNLPSNTGPNDPGPANNHNAASGTPSNTEPSLESSNAKRFLKGTLTYIGSLPTMREAYIIWETNVQLNPKLIPKAIPTFKKRTRLLEAQAIFSYVMSDEKDGYTATVLDVGQASCSYLIGKGKNRYRGGIFLDLGLPTASNAPKPGRDQDALEDNMERIIGWKPRAALLSHWHEDHVKAAFILDPANTFLRKATYRQMVWIAPVEDVALQSIRRLVYYLEKHCRTCWIDHTFDGGTISSYSGKSLLGKGRGTRKLTVKDPNVNGLIYLICSTVFPGDCMYRNWPKGLHGTSKRIANLIIPHHGAKLKRTDTSALDNIGFTVGKGAGSSGGRSQPPTGYVSYGTGNRYGHPDSAHLKELENRGFSKLLQRTACVGSKPYYFRFEC